MKNKNLPIQQIIDRSRDQLGTVKRGSGNKTIDQIIDRLQSKTASWKKEVTPDNVGSVWADEQKQKINLIIDPHHEEKPATKAAGDLANLQQQITAIEEELKNDPLLWLPQRMKLQNDLATLYGQLPKAQSDAWRSSKRQV